MEPQRSGGYLSLQGPALPQPSDSWSGAPSSVPAWPQVGSAALKGSSLVVRKKTKNPKTFVSENTGLNKMKKMSLLQDFSEPVGQLDGVEYAACPWIFRTTFRRHGLGKADLFTSFNVLLGIIPKGRHLPNAHKGWPRAKSVCRPFRFHALRLPA